MPVIVRRAREEDSRTIAEYALKLFAQHREYDPERFASFGNLEGAAWFYGGQANSNDAAVLVAEIDSKVVGFAYMQFEKINYPALLENAMWLHDIYVDEAARGTGAGKALLEASANVAKEFGAEKVILSVAARNRYAHEFFERNGYRPTMVEMTLNLGNAESLNVEAREIDDLSF
jgi:GNAT superfamily N-acetyltransferase